MSAQASAPQVFAFECRHKDREWPGTIYNAPTAGKARYQYLLDVRECWPDVRITDLRVRKIGGPHSSESFIRNAAYRGMPDIRCGQPVTVGDASGVIVGHNSGANFDVLFAEDSKYRGQVLSVHPGEVALL